MHVITVEQIKAARALLNWKQSDLAARSGLSLPSINNIERYLGSPRLSTLQTIRHTLQAAGITFLGNNGVQKHAEIFEMIEHQGDDFMRKLNDDLFLCMRTPADEVCMLGIDDRLYVKYTPEESIDYYHHQIKTEFRDRMLFRDDDDFFISRPESCRWISPALLGVIPYYVYHVGHETHYHHPQPGNCRHVQGAIRLPLANGQTHPTRQREQTRRATLPRKSAEKSENEIDMIVSKLEFITAIWLDYSC